MYIQRHAKSFQSTLFFLIYFIQNNIFINLSSFITFPCYISPQKVKFPIVLYYVNTSFDLYFITGKSFRRYKISLPYYHCHIIQVDSHENFCFVILTISYRTIDLGQNRDIPDPLKTCNLQRQIFGLKGCNKTLFWICIKWIYRNAICYIIRICGEF